MTDSASALDTASMADPETNCEAVISRVRRRSLDQAISEVFPKLDLAAAYSDSYVAVCDDSANDWRDALISQIAEAAAYLMS